ncbi:MAG: bifunctional precorrin-2 dehydrogenase/sirohydrochlorin ferrochelatase [Proteobacteria bacterium]|nr:bifunctional precorrin-2 dehydrogenase/sirohydrochlorin ferrochelatase [Pseudomonadota bacterium]
MRDYFPLFVSLADKKVLVIGGGKVAERKIRKLLKYSPKIIIISPELTEGLKNLSDKGFIEWEKRSFRESDLDGGVFLVISATDSKDLNDYIHKLCDERNILINKVSGRGRVIFPAIAEEGNISVAVSSSGLTPLITKILKKKIKELIRPYSKIVSIIKPLRSSLLTENDDSSYNKKILREVLSLSPLTGDIEKDIGLIKEKVKKILQKTPRSSKKTL